MTNKAHDDGSGLLNRRWKNVVTPNDQVVSANVLPEKATRRKSASKLNVLLTPTFRS